MTAHRTDDVNRLTPALRAFAEAHLGPFGEAAFCGWPHADALVWALKTRPKTLLKALKGPRKFVQETAGISRQVAATRRAARPDRGARGGH